MSRSNLFYPAFPPALFFLSLFMTVNCPIANGQFITNLTTQSQVDSFPILHPGATSVENLLIGYVEGNNGITDIHDLSPLSSIEKIYGDLYVRNNPHLKSLHGLHNVDSIFSYFSTRVQNNDSLTDLTGLSGAKYIARELLIAENDRLANLQGLEGLRISDAISIEKNPTLQNLEGLENLEVANGLLSIRGNDLNQINLPKLRRAESIIIRQEPSLGSLNGLSNLDSIGFCNPCNNSNLKRFWILDNDSLTNLSGLDDIILGQGAEIRVNRNKSLSDISIMPTWEMDSLKEISIIDNPNLGPELVLNGMRTVYTSIEIAQNGVLEAIRFPDLETVNTWVSPVDLSHPLDEFLSFKNNANLKTIDMPNLERVNRSFVIDENPSLESLEGLERLKEVKGMFRLLNNKSLSGLSDFEQFDHIGQYLFISGNNLASLDGLETLKFVGHGITVCCDSSLNDVSPISNVDSIGWNVPFMDDWDYGYLSIGLLPLLDSIDLQPVLFQRNYLGIGGNTNLKMVNLPSIEATYGLNLRNNGLLHSISFPSLKKIGEFNLTSFSIIHNNPSLTSLDGLSNVEFLMDSLSIRNNPMLSDCEAICYMLGHGMSPWRFQLGGNAFPCNSVPDIETHICDSLTAVHDPFRPAGLPQVLAMPNPTTGTFLLDIPDDGNSIKITVANSAGIVVYENQQHKVGSPIDISGLPPGVYFVRAKKQEGAGWVGKVIKR